MLYLSGSEPPHNKGSSGGKGYYFHQASPIIYPF